jgi:acyl dehydratase
VCVATNDNHPLHLDHRYAAEAGYQDVVVPGHMLIGWIGEYFETWCGGPLNLVSWRLRFTAPVWPGEQITLKGELVQGPAVAGPLANGKVTATTAEGKVVAVATAEMKLPANT